MRKPKKETKSKTIILRMSAGMFKQVTKQAASKNMNTQEYIRYLITKETDRTLDYMELR